MFWDERLTVEYFEKLPFICHWTGEELTFEANMKNTVSLDRVDSSKGYSPDNVVLCGSMVNKMKNDQTEKDFIDMCMSVVKRVGLDK